MHHFVMSNPNNISVQNQSWLKKRVECVLIGSLMLVNAHEWHKNML
jgi:hypothetical protein